MDIRRNRKPVERRMLGLTASILWIVGVALVITLAIVFW